MRESVTIGEFIEECYAYPYSKEYFELCQECAKSEIRALARECMDFTESVEFIGTDFFESGALSDPDYFLPYNESVFTEKTNPDLEKGLFTKLIAWIKKTAAKFARGMKKVLFGLKNEYKKMTIKQFEAEIAGKKWDKESIEMILPNTNANTSGRIEHGGSPKFGVAFWAEKPFGTAGHKMPAFVPGTPAEHKRAFNNYLGFISAVIKKGSVRVVPENTIWRRLNKKAGEADGEAVSAMDVMDPKVLAQTLVKIKEVKQNRGYDDLLKKIKNSKKAAAKGLVIPLSSEAIEEIIKELDEMETAIKETEQDIMHYGGKHKRIMAAHDVVDPKKKSTDEERRGAEYQRTLNLVLATGDKVISDIIAELSKAQGATLQFYVNFKKVYDFGVARVTEMRDAAMLDVKKGSDKLTKNRYSIHDSDVDIQ